MMRLGEWAVEIDPPLGRIKDALSDVVPSVQIIAGVTLIKSVWQTKRPQHNRRCCDQAQQEQNQDHEN